MEMRETAPITFAVTGGGTGGHVYPAVAILKALEELNYKGIYIGHQDKLESRVCLEEGIPFFGVEASRFYGLRLWRLLNPFPLIWAVLRCALILRRERVRFLVAVGGYVSVPAFLAAQLLRISCIVHEQNVKPGLANRFFLRFKPLFLTTFKTTAEVARRSVRAVHTGCPIDSQIGRVRKDDARARLGVLESQRVVLVVGGSGGAAALNTAALGLASLLATRRDIVLFHVTGKAYYETVQSAALETCNPALRDRYRILPYANPIAPYYAAADLIVSRSGAASINEIYAVGCPAIFVPSPNVAEDHQRSNALLLQRFGLAECVEESSSLSGQLEVRVKSMLDHKDKYRQRARGEEELKDPTLAAEVIAKTIDRYVSEHPHRRLL